MPQKKKKKKQFKKLKSRTKFIKKNATKNLFRRTVQ